MVDASGRWVVLLSEMSEYIELDRRTAAEAARKSSSEEVRDGTAGKRDRELTGTSGMPLDSSKTSEMVLPA